MNSLICPVSPKTINKRAVRVGAITTAILLIAFAVTQFWLILVFVVADYAIRVLTPFTAPVSWSARGVVKISNIEPKPMNKGPKIFAWRLGFLMAVAAILIFPFSIPASLVVALALAGLNLLDGVGNLCVGCLIYTYIVLPAIRPVESASTRTDAP